MILHGHSSLMQQFLSAHIYNNATADVDYGGHNHVIHYANPEYQSKRSTEGQLILLIGN